MEELLQVAWLKEAFVYRKYFCKDLKLRFKLFPISWAKGINTKTAKENS